MKPILKGGRFCQVGFVVNDLEAAIRKYALLFGVDEPEIKYVDNPEAPAIVLGEKSDATCRQAFFDLSRGVTLELIEPNEVSSAWRDALNEKGEGLHHIAFAVDDMDESIAECENLGMKLIQHGLYSNLKGRYAYMDGGEGYKCIIELLQNF